MPDGQLTPLDVVKQLSNLARDLDAVTEQLKEADDDSVRKRHAADLAESHAFINASGAMDMRKHLARIEAGDQELEALVAEALVRHLRKKISAIDTRIEVGRSMGTTLRAEIGLTPYGQGA